MKLATTQMLEKHKHTDTSPTGKTIFKLETRKLDRLQTETQQLRDFLKNNPEDRKGSRGCIRLTNRTNPCVKLVFA